MLVRERMTKRTVTVKPGDTLAIADARMKAGKFRRLPVMHEGQLVGILSEYDLQRFQDEFDTVLVAGAMTPNPVTVSALATVEHAVALCKRNEIGALPVVDHGKLVGIVTASNLWFPEPRPLPKWVKS